MTARMIEAWTAGRMLAWLIALPILKRVLPLPSLAARMWHEPAVPRTSSAVDIERLALMARWLAVRVWPRRSGTCLEQSLVLYRYLSARHASPVLVIGVRRDDARVAAHAWVTIDGRPVGQSVESLGEFSPIVRFGAKGIVLPGSGLLQDSGFALSSLSIRV